MIRMEVTKNLDVNSFRAFMSMESKNFYAAAMELVVGDIVRGIESGQQIQGGSLPSLEPETIAKKGHSQPLIDKGLLRDPFTYQKNNQWRINTGTITIKGRSIGGDMPRDKVGAKLQLQGVSSRRGRKFFSFFGISRDAEADVLTLLDEMILGALQQL